MFLVFMYFLYFYDLKFKTKKQHNRLKRKFYYHMHKLDLIDTFFKTKSVLMVPKKYEKLVDNFFLSFREDVEVYKAKTRYVEEL